MAGELEEAVLRQLVRLMLARVLDGNAHSRSHVMRHLAECVRRKVGVVRRAATMEEVLELSCARVVDKSPHVRRAALQLLEVVVEYFGELYRVQSKGESRMLTGGEAERKVQALAQRRLALLEECSELERLLCGDEFNVKIELESDLNQIEPRLEQLKEALERNAEEEKFVGKYVRFLQLLAEALPNVRRLFFSRSTPEAMEAVRLVVLLHQLQLEGAFAYVKAAMALVCSREPGMLAFVTTTFVELYFPDSQPPEALAERLLVLVRSCDLIESTCLEQLLAELSRTNP